MNHLKSEKGFALAMIMALLPVFVVGLIILFSVVNVTQTDLSVKHVCRKEGLTAQKRVAPLLTSLLNLNPLARSLRLQLLAAQAARALAIAQQNWLLVDKQTKKINELMQKRKELDIRQKQIIQQSNLILAFHHSATRTRLRQTLQSRSDVLMSLQMRAFNGKAPKLAVRPDDSDIAPPYSPQEDFEHKQSLAHEWQYRLSVRRPFSLFVSNEFDFKKSCAVTLVKENSKWQPTVSKGKFSWKSAW
ncbi:MAG: hypothetical protein HUU57_01480 [Bdellovibrio sp.]|nr:hypothetical protein [Bdellovibrio sp.]